MNKKFIFILICALFGFCCFSQSSEKISEVLGDEQISKGQAAYFVCVFKDFSDENVSETEAFSVLREKNLFSGKESSDEQISLGKACFLIGRASKMKGGIFYSIFHSERYAFREFKALGILPQYADPDQNVSGSEFLALLNEFEKKGNHND
ncbi:MAG: hypothetical protein UIB61_01060 [Treponema sp.]|jgi:hypothetical protein|nr:hypothetical protein [Treponema sp.]